MIALLDVNVLVALAWPNHIHHEPAMGWFRQYRSSGWATCPLTQSGFIRVSSNGRIMDDAKSPQQTMELLEDIVALPHHHFWMDDISLLDSAHVERAKLVGYRQVTDAHLLALALRHGGRLATFDRAILQLVPASLQPDRAVSLILT